MDKLDKHYLAGIWDADGSFGIASRSARKRGYQPFALITICDPKHSVIGDLIDEHFGFKCVWSSRRGNPKWKTAYRWTLSSQRACDFARAIEPYLRIKKERAQIMMEWLKIDSRIPFADRAPIHKKQEELFKRMKKLNKLGGRG